MRIHIKLDDTGLYDELELLGEPSDTAALTQCAETDPDSVVLRAFVSFILDNGPITTGKSIGAILGAALQRFGVPNDEAAEYILRISDELTELVKATSVANAKRGAN